MAQTPRRFLRSALLGLGLALCAAQAAEADDLVKAALAAESAFDSERALELFQAANAARPDDAFILQKIARQYSDLTVDAAGEDRKKELARLALEYSLRAHELAPDNAVNTLSVAISHGKLGLYSNTGDQIDHVRHTKEYAEKSLAQNPDYAWAHHVLGRWHYEVAKLGRTKRLFVGLFFGGLPKASSEQAVEFLQKAVALEPKNPTHHIELGFALLADGQTAQAREAMQRGLALPDREKHDGLTKRRAREALAALE